MEKQSYSEKPKKSHKKFSKKDPCPVCDEILYLDKDFTQRVGLIDDDDEIFTVLSKKMEVLNAIPIGKKTISSRVGKALGIKTRRALYYLDLLEDDGHHKSKWETVLHKTSDARTRARVFTRIN